MVCDHDGDARPDCSLVPGRRLVLLVVLTLLLGACRVDTTLTLRVRQDGSGTVQATVALDPAAVRAAEAGGTTLPRALRLSDLPAAGWRVHWERRRSGGAVLTVSKGFRRAADAAGVAGELAGPDGPLRRVRVNRSASTFETRWSFTAEADLAALRTGLASDAELAGRLTAQRVDVAALDAALRDRFRDALHLRVGVALPHARSRGWTVTPGRRVVLQASSSALDERRVVLAAVGAGLVLVALVVLVAGERRAARRRRRGATRSAPSVR